MPLDSTNRLGRTGARGDRAIQRTPDEVLALHSFVTLVRASESVMARVSEGAARFGLTHSQFGVLEALWHLGPMSQRRLATKLLQSGGNVSVVAGNLEKRGLIARRREPSDNRVMKVSLSAQGRRLIERAFPPVARMITECFEVLAGDEHRQLAGLCQRVGLFAAAGRGRKVPVPADDEGKR